MFTNIEKSKEGMSTNSAVLRLFFNIFMGHTGLPTKEETSESTVRNSNALFKKAEDVIQP